MSVSASIDINLSKNEGKNRSTVEIIEVLVNFGWNLVHDTYISYLPLGDKDDFDWQAEKGMSFETLTKIIEVKEQAEETVGIIMTWKDTDIGGTFLFWPPNKDNLGTFSMNIGINRQIITLTDDYNITDFQWYLPKLLVPLNRILTVEYFSFEQHI